MSGSTACSVPVRCSLILAVLLLGRRHPHGVRLLPVPRDDQQRAPTRASRGTALPPPPPPARSGLVERRVRPVRPRALGARSRRDRAADRPVTWRGERSVVAPILMLAVGPPRGADAAPWAWRSRSCSSLVQLPDLRRLLLNHAARISPTLLMGAGAGWVHRAAGGRDPRCRGPIVQAARHRRTSRCSLTTAAGCCIWGSCSGKPARSASLLRVTRSEASKVLGVVLSSRDLLPNVNELFEWKGFFGEHE